jgi:hypothetical protein
MRRRILIEFVSAEDNEKKSRCASVVTFESPNLVVRNVKVKLISGWKCSEYLLRKSDRQSKERTTTLGLASLIKLIAVENKRIRKSDYEMVRDR